MGTSAATVSVKLTDDKAYTTRVNWDGYLSWTGKILNEKFNDNDLVKVLDMIQGGEIHSFDDRKNELVEYYEDDDWFPIVSNTLGYMHEEYNYIFQLNENGNWEWFVEFSDYDDENDINTEIFTDLKTALREYGDRH